MANQTEKGKAFEFACAMTINDNADDAYAVQNTPLETARRCYDSLSPAEKDNYIRGAESAVRIIDRLEPMLFNGPAMLEISLATDAQGQAGDVRDVICRRGLWEIGLSCKHNHEAVKHSRLSPSIDFGKKWFGIPCSDRYFDKINRVFGYLAGLQQQYYGILWSDLEDKEHDVYVPILNAFIQELNQLDKDNPGVIPERLIRYLIGTHDFYKVIMEEKRRYTKIEGININGTLNGSCARQRALVDVPIMQMPTKFYEVGWENGNMLNTIHVVCDRGWNISMRIHNAESEVKTSLKFDVQLQAMPNSILTQIEPWEE